MTRDVILGQAVVDQFPVFADDGYSKVSGESSFIVNIWKDAVLQVASYTITEIGTSGEYKITFTPSAEGYWACEVLINSNKQLWFGEYIVSKADIEFSSSMAEDGATARFTVWGEDVHGRAGWLTSMTAEVRDASGALVVSLGSGIGPSPDGTFLFTCLVPVLHYNVPYYLSIVASNGSNSWVGNCGFVRVE